MKYLFLLLLLIPVVAVADLEENFQAAREAYRVGDASRLDVLAENLKNTVLEPYVTAYQLRLRMYTRNPAGLKEFIARPDNTPVIDQLRSDWLKYQAKLQNWDEFNAGFPRLLQVASCQRCL